MHASDGFGGIFDGRGMAAAFKLGARWLEENGVNAIIAQGVEAGGTQPRPLNGFVRPGHQFQIWRTVLHSRASFA
jgi:NAD(P)H-dependent flavin oxidoreductase YrpB (nitropropane dioxygenase family)